MSDATQIEELEKIARDAARNGDFNGAYSAYKEILPLQLSRLDRVKAFSTLANYAYRAGLKAESITSLREALEILGDGPWQSNEEAHIHGMLSGALAKQGGRPFDWIYIAASLSGLVFGALIGIKIFPGSFLSLVVGAVTGSLILSLPILNIARIAAAQLLAMTIAVPPQFAGGEEHRQKISKIARIILLVLILFGIWGCITLWNMQQA